MLALYNLETDPNEKKNILGEKASKEILAELKGWALQLVREMVSYSGFQTWTFLSQILGSCKLWTFSCPGISSQSWREYWIRLVPCSSVQLVLCWSFSIKPADKSSWSCQGQFPPLHCGEGLLVQQPSASQWDQDLFCQTGEGRRTWWAAFVFIYEYGFCEYKMI